MDETKVQIGDDVLLDIGTHSDWYISTFCYDNESVNIVLCRKINRNNRWWVAEQTESQTEDGEDYLRGYQDGYNAREMLDRAGVEIHIDKPRGYTLKSDTNDACKPKGEQQGDILLQLHHTGFVPQIKPIK